MEKLAGEQLSCSQELGTSYPGELGERREEMKNGPAQAGRRSALGEQTKEPLLPTPHAWAQGLCPQQYVRWPAQSR
ncbi:hypothetical protein P7K49_030591, partial [Saguinus oedipus]